MTSVRIEFAEPTGENPLLVKTTLKRYFYSFSSDIEVSDITTQSDTIAVVYFTQSSDLQELTRYSEHHIEISGNKLWFRLQVEESSLSKPQSQETKHGQVPYQYVEKKGDQYRQQQSSFDSDTDLYSAEDETPYVNKTQQRIVEANREAEMKSRNSPDQMHHSRHPGQRRYDTEQRHLSRDEYDEHHGGYQEKRDPYSNRRQYTDERNPVGWRGHPEQKHGEPQSGYHHDGLQPPYEPFKEERPRLARSPRLQRSEQGHGIWDKDRRESSMSPEAKPHIEKEPWRGQERENVEDYYQTPHRRWGPERSAMPPGNRFNIPPSQYHPREEDEHYEHVQTPGRPSRDFDYERDHSSKNPNFNQRRYHQRSSPYFSSSQHDQWGHESEPWQNRHDISFHEEHGSNRLYRGSGQQEGRDYREGPQGARQYPYYPYEGINRTYGGPDQGRYGPEPSQYHGKLGEDRPALVPKSMHRKTGQKTTIEVSGYSRHSSLQTLERYFSINVGDICDFFPRKRCAMITFTHPLDDRIFKKKHIVDGSTLKIRAIDRSRIQLDDIPDDVDHMKLVRYVKRVADLRSKPEIVYGEDQGTAVVSFGEQIDLETVLEDFADKKFGRDVLVATPLHKPDAILVTGIGPGLSTKNIETYFNDKSDENVTDVKMVKKARAVVTFYDARELEISEVLLTTHKICGHAVKVVAYYDILGGAASTEGPPMKVPEPVEIPVNVLLAENILGRRSPYIDDIRKELYSSRAELVWPNGSDDKTVRLEPSTKGVEDSSDWHHWKENVSQVFEDIMSRYDASNISIPPEHWDDLCGSLDDIGVGDVRVAPSKDKKCILIAGHLSDFGQAKSNIENLMKNIKNEAQRKALITKRPLKVKASSMKQLSFCGIYEHLQTQFKDVQIKLSPDALEVIFEGNKEEVAEAQAEMFSQLDSLERKTFTPHSSVRKFLATNVNMLQEILGSKHILAALDFDDSRVVVYGATAKDTQSALDYLQTEIVVRSIPLPNEGLLSALQSNKGNLLISSLTIKQSVTVSVNAIDLCVDVTGFFDAVDEACPQINEFMTGNTIVTKFIPLDKGKLEFLTKFRGRDLNEIASKNQHHSVTVAPKPGKQPGIAVSGTAEGVKLACSILDTLIDRIVDRQHPIVKPGGPELFKDNKLILKSVSDDHECIINVMEKQDDSTRVDETSNHVPMKEFICRYSTREGQVFLVKNGDITEENVDVIVNAANTKLEHEAGLSAAIVKKGGRVIQTESFKVLMQKGRDLRIGEVVRTPGGNLQCRYVLHVAGPQWRGGSAGKEEKLLYQSINNVLEEALKLGVRSVAMSAISSGGFGFPIDLCAHTILEATADFCQKHKHDGSLKEVSFTNIEQRACDAFVQAMRDTFGAREIEYPTDQVYEEEYFAVTDSVADMTVRSMAAKFSSSPPPLPSRFRPNSSSNTIETQEGKFVTLKKGSIAKETVDVIVNTTGSKMNLTDGGVSKALASEAGPDLQKEVDKVVGTGKGRKDVPAGGFIETRPTQSLNCKKIYHSVCLEYKDRNAEKVLRSLLQDIFTDAQQSGMKSIALPAFGTGNLNFPREVTAKIMFEEVFKFSQNNSGSSLHDFRFVVFDQGTIQAFEDEMQQLRSSGGNTYDSGHPKRALRRDQHVISPSRPGLKNAGLNVSSGLQDLGGGITQMVIGLVTVQLQQSNLTKENTDAIVNSVGDNLRLSGAVSAAILKDGGSSISDECDNIRKRGSVPDIVRTGSGRLACRTILHVHLRNFSRIKESTLKLLQFAEQDGLRSIAIPAIGTGNIGGDSARAANDILDAIGEFAMNEKPRRLLLIKLSIFQPPMVSVFRNAMSGKVGVSFVRRKGYMARGVDAVRKGLSAAISVPDLQVIRNIPMEDENATETIIFHIIAGDKRDLDKAVETIEDFMKKEITKEVITYDSKEMGELDDMRISAVKTIGKKYKLRVDPVLTGNVKKFLIEGQKLNIQTAKADIQEFFAKLQAAEVRRTREALYNQTVRWRWFNSEVNVFEDYDEDVNPLIESAYVDKKPSVELELEDGKIVINFKTMKEIDLFGRREVEVRRIDLKKETKFNFPSNWTRMGDKDPYVLVPLVSTTQEYKGVVATITKSLAVDSKLGYPFKPSSIVKIERVQNKKLYRMYAAFRDEMMTRLPKTSSIERVLYHGTSQATCEQIDRGGFNRSYTFKPSNGTVYGKGTYFATHASSSVGYAAVDGSGLRRMYMCKVMVGEYTGGSTEMFVPPPKPNSKDKYDSLVDDVKDPHIFVAFLDAQAYPEYLITFK